MNISTTNKVIIALVALALMLALVMQFGLRDKTQNETNDQSDQLATEPMQYKDLVRVDVPLRGDTVTSPITITGEARGPWFFEATFPIIVVDSNDLIIGEGFAEATGDWMTEEYVPFKAEIKFEDGAAGEGAIVLMKSNASGMPEHDDEFDLPITFGN